MSDSRITYRTILVPLDGSSFSERALPVAATLAKAAQARIMLVRAAWAAVPIDLEQSEAWAAAVEEAQSYLDGVAARLKGHGLEVEGVAPYAPAAQGILREITLQRADLVVMCTHGRSGLGRWLYGSVAEEVLVQSPVPVLLVRPTGPPPELAFKTEPASLLVPLDGSTFSEAALPYAAALAHVFDATITLVRAVTWPVLNYGAVPWNEPTLSLELAEFEAKEEAEAKEYLAGVATDLRQDSLRVKTLVRVGWPPAVICNEAELAHAGLIVMATHARSGLELLREGSVALEVVRLSSLPILLVRSADPEQTDVGTELGPSGQ